MVKISTNVLHKYRYLIFILVYFIVSALLVTFFVGAISQNIGKGYWHVFKEAYLPTLFLVVIVSAAILFTTFIVSRANIFEGKGGFLALVIVYIIAVAIMGPLTYYGLLKFNK
ncbi:MAG: hypothetical protein ACFFA0_09695 [Promethearchaeota archaeon]